MAILSVVLQSLLVAYFVFSGTAKIVGAKYWTEMFAGLKLPQWFRVVTGFIQLIGAAGLMIGYWIPGVVSWAGIWLGMTMLVAFVLHIRVKDPLVKTLPPVVFAAIIVTVILLYADDMSRLFA
ncbi:DoxX family protein [Paenibacillaceae bacterium WGS1546]|uniref:DoxX family protein n=1 Tax=Cohnella sp. WGS1546 TaxID=3366810 RepID=UPI00372D0490